VSSVSICGEVLFSDHGDETFDHGDAGDLTMPAI
jgi:hypothetical protein